MEETGANSTTVGAEETFGQHNIYIIIAASIMFISIIMTGVVGNFSVIWVICNYNELRKSVMNIYIFNMALADLMLNLLGIPEVVQFIMDRGWILGEAPCKILRYCMVNSLYVSILSLLAVTVERYVAIIHPMQAHALLTRRRITIATCTIWLVSIACALPTAIFLTVRQMEDGKSYCILALSESRSTHLKLYSIYKYLEFGIFFAAPLVSQVTLYVLISKRLRASTNRLRISLDHSKQRNKQKTDESSPLNGANKSEYVTTEMSGGGQYSYPSEDGNTFSKIISKKRQSMADWRSSNTIKSRQHVIRMLTACVVVYSISYTPTQVLLFHDTFSKQPFHQSWLFRAIMISLGFLNAAANPIIYCACSQTYRSRFRVMYCCDKENTRRGRRLRALDSTIRSGGGGSTRTVTTSRGDTINDIRLHKRSGNDNDESEYYNSQLDHSLLIGSSKPAKI